MSNFVHLHCHTEFSLLDGAIRVKDLCARAKDFGMPAAAITDHGNMFGAANFYVACKDYGITPIIGCEVYVCKDHTDRTSEFSRVRHHLILLAKDMIGYKNLLKLVTHSNIHGFHYKPRVDKTLLRDHSEGLVALSACIAGEIPRTLLGTNKCIKTQDNFASAMEVAKEYAQIYPDNFYLELQDNTLPDQARLNQELLKLAEATKLPIVASNDCHYLNADDVEAHDILLCIQTQAKQQDEKRMRFDAKDLYYKSPEEMDEAFKDHKEAIENTLVIADKCSHLELDFKHNYFPVYDLPENMTLETEFIRLAKEGLELRLEKHPDKDNIDKQVYYDRLDLELKVICEMGFPGYFLIVQDFINWAKNNQIPVGPGRGSAAGSLVAWSLKITNLDPLPYNLLFERFLNIERISLPDIDVDFCEDRRVEVIRYVTEKYGVDKVAQITTFGTMKAKAVIRDVGRALDIPLKETDVIAKLIPLDLKMTIDKALKLEPELSRLYENDGRIRNLLDISKRLEGLTRHASTHAAGVVMSDKAMSEYLPLYCGKKNELVTQYDMKMVEKVGLVKFDFLGLKTMTLLHRCLDNIKRQNKEAPDLDTLPLTDSATYELYSKGDTDGIFQVESSGMRQYLRQLKPNCFEDIIAMIALYRPGPLGSGMVDEFIKRKHGELKVVYPVPQLEECLKDTYGVIVYQEQVMQISQIVGGYSLGGADLLRRAMGKKNAEAMAKERANFVSGAEKLGTSTNKANEIFNLMETFAEYGFNKSHSAAYALISYHTAYLKLHFKSEFMAAVLSSEMGNKDKILKYIAACKDMAVEVLAPNINTSQANFSVVDEKIVFGLGAIKNIGDEAINSIIETREQNGEFTSLLDLCQRVNLRKVSKRILENLIKSGAFDCFNVSRAGLIASIENAQALAQKRLKEKSSNQISLFNLMPVEEAVIINGLGYHSPESECPEWSDEIKQNFEKEALGFFLSSHPLQPYRQEALRLGLTTIEDAKSLASKTQIKLGVLVTSCKEIITKKGNKMAFLSVEDLTGQAEVTFFPESYQSSKLLLESDKALELTAIIDGQTSAYQNDEEEEVKEEVKLELKLLAESVRLLSEASSQNDQPILLKLPEEKQTDLALEELKLILAKHKGNTQIILEYVIDDVICQSILGQRYAIALNSASRTDIAYWEGRKAFPH